MSAVETTKFLSLPQSSTSISAICVTNGRALHHMMTATKAQLVKRFSTGGTPAPCQCGPHVFGMGFTSRTRVFTGSGTNVENRIPSMSSTNVRAALFNTKSVMYGVVASH
eukprot:CAMPEP_0179205028 /NCGR_PEP_ID=MMETSP0796-20121207/102212_1 /TAXON_ID=73915 /ORGANISM="Pyrodinium bahamense, Strain pbaha01" /LENGTH=109 /DNA_ID=CAMNT_0020909913 /DNA_START=1214 /DNA_END=1540 /DNA_ORIENTATION=-